MELILILILLAIAATWGFWAAVVVIASVFVLAAILDN